MCPPLGADALSMIFISETCLSSSLDLFLHCTFHSQSSSLQTFLGRLKLSNKTQLKKNSPVSKMMHRYSYSSSIKEMRHYPVQQDIFTWLHFTWLRTQIPHIYSSQCFPHTLAGLAAACIWAFFICSFSSIWEKCQQDKPLAPFLKVHLLQPLPVSHSPTCRSPGPFSCPSRERLLSCSWKNSSSTITASPPQTESSSLGHAAVSCPLIQTKIFEAALYG